MYYKVSVMIYFNFPLILNKMDKSNYGASGFYYYKLFLS